MQLSTGAPQEVLSKLKPLAPPAGRGGALKPISAADVTFQSSTNAAQPTASSQSEQPHNPLRKFSLLGSSAELERLAQEQTPLLGSVCLKGQSTVFYARPNTGKTLITLHLLREAVEQGRLCGDDGYYLGADDNNAGVREKLGILQQHGIHVLAPGLNGFDAKALPPIMKGMIATGAAKDAFIILDTLKKFVSLMDKRQSTEFAELARQFTLKGGTVLGLAHTNKRNGADGKPIFAGTSDILDDFDCGYMIAEVPQQSSAVERVVQFDCIKSRGDVAQQVAYKYAIGNGLSYLQKLNSVQIVTSDQVTQMHRESNLLDDRAAVEAIEMCIAKGSGGKMDIALEVAARCNIGRQSAIRIIDKYSGESPAVHRWTYTNGSHGKKSFVLLPGSLTLPPCAEDDDY